MIELTVSDVRAALSAVARPGDRGTGEAATLLLGRLFHEVFAELVGIQPERSGLRVILEAGPERQVRVESLREHAWRRLVAPRLLRHAAELQTTTDAVLTLWRAVEQLTGWLVDIVGELSRQATLTAPGGLARRKEALWEHLGALLRAEVPLECDLREPTWAEPVRLIGIADSLLRVPGRAAHCAIEIKLGRAAPPIDLGQAALYRLLLVRSGAQSKDAALALLRFNPELEEQVFEGPSLEEAESRLLDLIAGLARVPRVDAPAPITVASRASVSMGSRAAPNPGPQSAPITPVSPVKPNVAPVKPTPPLSRVVVSGAPVAVPVAVAGVPGAGVGAGVGAPVAVAGAPVAVAETVAVAAPVAVPGAPANTPVAVVAAPANTPVATPTFESEAPPNPHIEMGRKLRRACGEQGVGIDLVHKEPIVGPRFLRFEVRLLPGARVDALRKRMPEVRLRLSLPQEPIVTAEAGFLFVDVARPDPETILFERIVPQLPALDPLVGSARLPIGVDSAGRLHSVDLASAGRSHVLVAGTSGSGKSEWLRTAVAGLFACNTPETLRIVTIDPKLNAFGDLERSRFLWRPDAYWVPGSGREATDLFDDLIEEMERRYQLTRASQTDNLAEHVRKTGRPLPRIVCFCDEYMALVTIDAAAKKRIEQSVTLLGAKARAAGIHLVLATQQPSRAVVSGAIQANLPCRVAMTLTSHIESNMILGAAGAERLTFNGDLLYRDFGDPQRLQAPLLPAEERRRRFGG